MDKHAYLLMIHEKTLVLKRLMQLIDDERNDIYIHADRNAIGLDVSEIKSYVKKSKIYFIKRYKIYWGTNSITKAEIKLLKTAIKMGGYSYYHFLSGADLPIKTQNQIHNFFKENQEVEFIHFGTEQYQKDIQERYSQYHFFSKQLGRKRDKKFWVMLETYSLAIQRRLHIDRVKNNRYKFYGGSNWCSLSNRGAHYVAEHYSTYRRAFWFTQISDEAVFQTIMMDSAYKNNIFMPEFKDDYMANIRYIDWKRGNPYIFTKDDFDELINSSCMFARKFDEKTDSLIIEKLYRILSENIEE